MVAGLGTNTGNEVVQALLVQREGSSRLLVTEVGSLGQTVQACPAWPWGGLLGEATHQK